MAHADNVRRVLLSLDGSDAADYAFETYMTTLKRDGDDVVLFTCQELGDSLQSFWKTTVLSYDKAALAERLKKEEESKKALLRPYGDRLALAGVTLVTNGLALVELPAARWHAVSGPPLWTSTACDASTLQIHFKPVIAVSDSPGHSILSAAHQADVGIIVMGTRGRGILLRTFLGSCSDYVIRHSHVPVVVCPRGAKVKSVR